METTNEGAPGLLPIEWSVWFTIVVVAAMFAIGTVAESLRTGPALAVQFGAIALGVLAAHEIWAKLRHRF
jgi:hypothetical protein